MPIPFKCSVCGFSARVSDDMAGKPGKCPKCMTVLKVPEAGIEMPKVNVESYAKTVRKPAKSSFFREYWILLLGLISLVMAVAPLFLAWLDITGLFWQRFWVIGAGALGIALSLLAAIVRGCLAFKQRSKSSKAAEHYRRGLCAACFCLFVVACLSAHNRSVLLTLLYYAAISLSLLCAVEYWMALKPAKWVRKAGLGFGVLILIAWWQCDYSVYKWEKPAKEYEPFDSSYVDYYRRGAELPYYRKYSQAKKGSFLPWYRAEGHMTDAGSQHGKWEWYSCDWDAKPFVDDMGYKFYWYGEQITEADWHMKNKD